LLVIKSLDAICVVLISIRKCIFSKLLLIGMEHFNSMKYNIIIFASQLKLLRPVIVLMNAVTFTFTLSRNWFNSLLSKEKKGNVYGFWLVNQDRDRLSVPDANVRVILK